MGFRTIWLSDYWAFGPQTLVSYSKNICSSSSLLQGKHLPFSPSPLRLNIFRLFVILSLTQVYRYTPEIFLFSTATFKYTYRAPLRRIGQLAKGSQISEKYWGEVGKGKRADIYLEVRKRRGTYIFWMKQEEGIYFLNETSVCVITHDMYTPKPWNFWYMPY